MPKGRFFFFVSWMKLFAKEKTTTDLWPIEMFVCMLVTSHQNIPRWAESARRTCTHRDREPSPQCAGAASLQDKSLKVVQHALLKDLLKMTYGRKWRKLYAAAWTAEIQSRPDLRPTAAPLCFLLHTANTIFDQSIISHLSGPYACMHACCVSRAALVIWPTAPRVWTLCRSLSQLPLKSATGLLCTWRTWRSSKHNSKVFTLFLGLLVDWDIVFLSNPPHLP